MIDTDPSLYNLISNERNFRRVGCNYYVLRLLDCIFAKLDYFTSKRLLLIAGLAVLTLRPASAACTALEAKEKGALAWDRAAALEARDQQRGSWLQQYILSIETDSRINQSNDGLNKICAQYDKIVKAADEALTSPVRQP